jgi:hypothetical protein
MRGILKRVIQRVHFAILDSNHLVLDGDHCFAEPIQFGQGFTLGGLHH